MGESIQGVVLWEVLRLWNMPCRVDAGSFCSALGGFFKRCNIPLAEHLVDIE